MKRAIDVQTDFFSRLAGPFTGESLFDCLPDLVFFIKNEKGEYVVVNQTLVLRSGRKDKAELIGRRADEIFPAPLGESYRAQDEQVLASGEPVRDQLELHFHVTGGRGWCITNKLALRNREGRIIGLTGVSRDLKNDNGRAEEYPQIAEVVRFIHTHYSEPLKVKELAARAGLSEYQFEQRIRNIFQITAGQLIQKVRMEASLRRLRETENSVAQIASECGYTDQSAFARQFRQTLGLSPSEYRRSSAGTK